MSTDPKFLREQRQLHRLETLTDSVYALAIVIILFWLPTPDQGIENHAGLFDFLVANRADLLSCLIGIVVVVIYWLRSNHLMGHLVRTDNGHTAITILQVFFLLLYLYVIRIGVEAPEVHTLAEQSICVALVGFAGAGSWWYACRHRKLLDESAGVQIQRDVQVEVLSEPITALITLPLAYVNPLAWELGWLAYPVISWILKRRKLPEETSS
jgi:uncharacterized membrane protein